MTIFERYYNKLEANKKNEKKDTSAEETKPSCQFYASPVKCLALNYMNCHNCSFYKWKSHGVNAEIERQIKEYGRRKKAENRQPTNG